ncbi:hypothetical protein [Streptomyces sp. NPDC054765]
MTSQDIETGAAWCRPVPRCPRRIGRFPPLPLASAVPVVLTAAERHRLKKMTYGHKTPHQARQRATIVLLAA